MFQRMRSLLTIDVNEDMTDMTDIEVTIEQDSSEHEFTYSGASISVDGNQVTVDIPKSDADVLDYGEAYVQVMFTRPGGVPDATQKVKFDIEELLKDNGYGI